MPVAQDQISETRTYPLKKQGRLNSAGLAVRNFFADQWHFPGFL